MVTYHPKDGHPPSQRQNNRERDKLGLSCAKLSSSWLQTYSASYQPNQLSWSWNWAELGTFSGGGGGGGGGEKLKLKLSQPNQLKLELDWAGLSLAITFLLEHSHSSFFCIICIQDIHLIQLPLFSNPILIWIPRKYLRQLTFTNMKS